MKSFEEKNIEDLENSTILKRYGIEYSLLAIRFGGWISTIQFKNRKKKYAGIGGKIAILMDKNLTTISTNQKNIT